MGVTVPGCLMISKMPLYSDGATWHHIYTNFKIGAFLIGLSVSVYVYAGCD